MRLDLIRSLGITITGGKIMLVNDNDSQTPFSDPPTPNAHTLTSNTTVVDMRKQYPELFSGKVGLAKSYVHKVKVCLYNRN